MKPAAAVAAANQQTKDENNELSFFEVLSRIQSNRLDDQRCSIKHTSNRPLNKNTNNENATSAAAAMIASS
jgi:hypothetical protein